VDLYAGSSILSEANSSSATEGHAQGGAAAGATTQTALEPVQNPRSRGHSPRRDQLEASKANQPADQEYELDGQKWTGKQLREAIAAKAQTDVRATTLPQSADGYEFKLPVEFKPPEGMTFEFDKNDPLLAEARKAALDMKLDQAGFSRMLGLYAANKIKELEGVNRARVAEMEKLGAAGPQRIDAIERWVRAKVGPKADVLMKTVRQYPVAAVVETFEKIIHEFSSQGGVSFDQRHREQPDQGKIPGYEGMTFLQRRAAQEQLNSRGHR
jgi:hypothetical protein